MSVTYWLRDEFFLFLIVLEVCFHHKLFAEFYLTLLGLADFGVDFFLSAHPEYGEFSVIFSFLQIEPPNVEFKGQLEAFDTRIQLAGEAI